MSENSVILPEEIESDRIAEEIRELRYLTSEKTKKEIQKLKKKLNRSLWLFGSSLVVALFVGVMLTSTLNNLKSDRQQLIQQIESLQNNQVSVDRVETIENQMNSLREEIKELRETRDSVLPDLFPGNSDRNLETPSPQNNDESNRE